MSIKVDFDRGSLVVTGIDSDFEHMDLLSFDERTLNWRAPAMAYRDIVFNSFKSTIILGSSSLIFAA